MNCPHGRTDEQFCDTRHCRQNVFEHPSGRMVRVVRLLCDTCGFGMGTRSRGGYGSGMSARTIREFTAAHGAHDTHWKLVDVDSGLETLGGGALPIAFDNDEEALQ
jgi:hypothetical protein